jgi:spermidine synthase
MRAVFGQRLVYVLLAISGFSALGYQLCWIRACTLTFGSTTSALSTVTAAFFAGIALGAFFFGKISAGRRPIIPVYGLLEIVIGVIALVTLPMLGVSDAFFGTLNRNLHAHADMLLALRTAIIIATITPAAVLIGGAFPLGSQLAAGIAVAGKNSDGALLYAASTFGSCAGCLITGFVLIPGIGIAAANYLNAGISMALGISILLLQKFFLPNTSLRNTPPFRYIDEEKVVQPDSEPVPRIIMYLLFAATGAVSLGYEVLWTRFLSLVIHITAFTYVFSLATILLGIALGSLLIRGFAPRQSAFWFGLCNVAIGLAFSFIMLRPVSTWNWAFGSMDVFTQAAFCIAIFLVPSLLMGASFPLAMRMVTSDSRRYGKHIGALVSVNTAGGIAGALGVGFVLLPSIGMQATLMLLTNISILAGVCALLFATAAYPFAARAVFCGSGLVVWSLVWMFAGIRLPDAFLGRSGSLIAVKEGRASFLSVVRNEGKLSLEIDAMWQGQKSRDYQIMAAHIPMMLHRAPERVLVIGVGTGQTARRFLMYDVKQLDCADIEADLPLLIRRYFDGAWLDDPRVRYLAEDGRTIVAHYGTKYDVISIEAGQTFRPQAAALYTADFYKKVARSLKPDGLACQFVPIGFLSTAEFASVVRTFIEIFPYSTFWFNKYAELILIGSPERMPHISAERIRLLAPGTRVHADLEYSFKGDSTRAMNRLEIFAASFLMGMDGLRKMAARGDVYRDDKPVLEYRTACLPYSANRFHTLIERHLEDPASVIDTAFRAQVDSTAGIIQRANVHFALK